MAASHRAATAFKQPVKLALTSSGRHCVKITDEGTPREDGTQSEDEVLTVTENKTAKEEQRTPLKRHKQFGTGLSRETEKPAGLLG